MKSCFLVFHLFVLIIKSCWSEFEFYDLFVIPFQVVPLSQRSGIVEWCENTVPLGEYLIGVRGIGGAHSRYYPTDWTAAECRKRITVSNLPFSLVIKGMLNLYKMEESSIVLPI